MKKIVILFSIYLILASSIVSFAADKIERTKWNKSSSTACSQAIDQARLAVKNHCHYKGGIKEALGGGCETKDVSKAYNGRQMYASTVTFSVTCHEK